MAPMSSSAPASSLCPPAPVLVERERELRPARPPVRRRRGGDGRAALVEGPAGIGKSRLLAEARRRGRRAGHARARRPRQRAGARVPFGVVRQLFEAGSSTRSRASGLAGGRGAGARGARRPDDAGRRPGDASFAALHGLYWLALNLAAERPLLLALDDLHWATAPRCASSPTSCAGSRACRCWWPRPLRTRRARRRPGAARRDRRRPAERRRAARRRSAGGACAR